MVGLANLEDLLQVVTLSLCDMKLQLKLYGVFVLFSFVYFAKFDRHGNIP